MSRLLAFLYPLDCAVGNPGRSSDAMIMSTKALHMVWRCRWKSRQRLAGDVVRGRLVGREGKRHRVCNYVEDEILVRCI